MHRAHLLIFALSLCGVAALAQSENAGFSQRPAGDAPEPPAFYTVTQGTKIPLGLINSVSTKHSVAGDRIYLETVFPIVINNHIVIPPGSYVTGTVTDVKRAGHVKGRAELYVRFDSLTLPNGVTRDFRARLGSIDARGDERLDKKEGQIQGDSNKGGDVRTVIEGGATGAGIGSIVGLGEGHAGMGAGIGGAAGAAAGLAAVLLTRGPDAVLAKGSTVEMILDRTLTFAANEVNFTSTGTASHLSDGPGPVPEKKGSVMNPTQTQHVPF
jgi:type IV secretion system protein VirB10